MATVALVASLGVGAPASAAGGAITSTLLVTSSTEGSVISTATNVASFASLTAFTGTTAAQFTATISWGDGSTQPGVIADDGVGKVTVSDSYGFSFQDECSCAASVTLSSASTGNAVATAQGTIAVADAGFDGPGFFSSFAPKENTPVPAKTLLATVLTSTADGVDSAGGFSATVDWGDGSASQSATVLWNGSEGFDIVSSAPHTYADECTCTVAVQVADNPPGTSTQTITGSVTVAEADAFALQPTTVAAVEGAPFTATVATAFGGWSGSSGSVHDPADFTAYVDWGDGTLSFGTVTTTLEGYAVAGTHTYAEQGVYPVNVVITDPGGGGAFGPVASTVTVADAPLTATGVKAFTITNGVSFTHALARFTDADPGGTLADYTATVNWGDGLTSPATIAKAKTGYSVSSTHTYAATGKHKVTVTITEESGQTVQAITHVTSQ